MAGARADSLDRESAPTPSGSNTNTRPMLISAPACNSSNSRDVPSKTLTVSTIELPGLTHGRYGLPTAPPSAEPTHQRSRQLRKSTSRPLRSRRRQRRLPPRSLVPADDDIGRHESHLRLQIHAHSHARALYEVREVACDVRRRLRLVSSRDRNTRPYKCPCGHNGTWIPPCSISPRACNRCWGAEWPATTALVAFVTYQP